MVSPHVESKTLENEIDLQICSPTTRPEQICGEMATQMVVNGVGEGNDEAKGPGTQGAGLSEFLKIQQELFEKDHPHGLTATSQGEENIEECQQVGNTSSTMSAAFIFSDPSASIANTASGAAMTGGKEDEAKEDESPERRMKGSAGSEIKRFFGKVLSGMRGLVTLGRGG